MDEDVPPALRSILKEKLRSQIFDADSAFALGVDDDCLPGHRACLVTTRALAKESDIFLCDHLWSFPGTTTPAGAQAMLEEPQMFKTRRRLWKLLEMEGEEEEGEGERTAKRIAERMWPLVGQYSYPLNKDQLVGPVETVMYIMDEVGSRFCEVFPRRSLRLELEYEDGGGRVKYREAGFRCDLVFHPVTKEAFTAFWPRRDVDEGEPATCDSLPHGQAVRLARLQVLEGVGSSTTNEEEEKGREGEEGKEEEEEEKEEKKKQMIETAHRLRSCLEAEGYCDVNRISSLLRMKEECGKLLLVWEMSDPRLRVGCVTNMEKGRKTLEAATADSAAAASAATAAPLDASSSSSTSTAAGASVALAAASAPAPCASLVFLIEFFLMGSFVARGRLLHYIPDHDLLQRLEDLGLILVDGHDADDSDEEFSSSSNASRMHRPVKSLVQITPVPFRDLGPPDGYGCALVLTDFSQVGGGGGGFDPVMYVGPDSLGLVGALPLDGGGAAGGGGGAGDVGVDGGGGTQGEEEEKGGLISRVSSPPPRRILDVCAGCGVQGIVAALRALNQQQQQQQQQEQKQQQQEQQQEGQEQQQQGLEEVTLLELNPRAVRFATFNAALNHLEKQVTVLQADVRTVTPADLPSPAYDVVLCNPPYIPNPEKSARQLHQYGDGGATGEEITQGVVGLAAQVLSRGDEKKERREGGEGWLYLVGNLVNVDTLPERVEKWWNDGLQLLGEGKGEKQQQQQQQQLQIKAFHGPKSSPAGYAALIHNHRDHDTAMALTKDPDVGRYKEALEAAGVKDVTNGFVFVKCARENDEVVGVGRSSGNGSSEKSSSSSSSKKDVVALQEHLWMVLAMDKDSKASAVRRKLAEGWL